MDGTREGVSGPLVSLLSKLEVALSESFPILRVRIHKGWEIERTEVKDILVTSSCGCVYEELYNLSIHWLVVFHVVDELSN